MEQATQKVIKVYHLQQSLSFAEQKSSKSLIRSTKRRPVSQGLKLGIATNLIITLIKKI